MIYEISAGDIPAIIAAHKRAERMEANSKLGYLKEDSFFPEEEVEIVPTLACVSSKRKLRVSEPRRAESKKVQRAEREEGLVELLEKLFIPQDPKRHIVSLEDAKRYSAYKEFQRHNDEIQKIRNERKARELLQFLQYLMK